MYIICYATDNHHIPISENCCCCSACKGRVRRMEVMINQLFCFLSDFIPEEVSGKIQELQQEDFDKNWREEELTKIQPDPTVYGQDNGNKSQKSVRSYRAPRQHKQHKDHRPPKQYKSQRQSYDKKTQKQHRQPIEHRQPKQKRYNSDFQVKQEIKQRQKQREKERENLSTYSEIRHILPDHKPLFHGKPEYKPGPSLKQKFRKQFTLEQKRQIVSKVQEGCRNGQKIADICARYNVSDRSYQRWKKMQGISEDSPVLFQNDADDLVITHANF